MYQYFNFLIASDLPLPELPEVDEGNAAYAFSLQPAREFVTKDWIHYWRHDDGNTFLMFAREGNIFYLRFPETADFSVVTSTGNISCWPLPGITENIVRHLLLNQVLPRVAGHDGRIILHASAISVDDQAILFMGVPWSGKSTLAAYSINRGTNLLADDCVLLEKKGNSIFALANYPGSRLWQDSLDALQNKTNVSQEVTRYPMKKRLIYGGDKQNNHPHGLPVKAIFLLDSQADNKHLKIKKIKGSRVIPELLKYTFMLDVLDRDKMKEKFDAHGKVALSIPLYHLDYPREYSVLGKVFEAVTGLLFKTPIAISGIQ